MKDEANLGKEAVKFWGPRFLAVPPLVKRE
jgi:hypothetical protein